jgi:iron(III) transport system substrate-binding protein
VKASGSRGKRVVAGLAVLAILLPAAARAQPAAWQSVWTEMQVAAKREGALVVATSPDPPRRDFLLKQWKEDYPEIELSLSIANAGFVPRLATERQAGKYLWDILHTGPTTGFDAIRGGMLDPLLPELILPEVRDPASWGGWDDAFFDAGKRYMLGLVTDLLAPYYDAKAIAPEKAATLGLKLLLDPALKGRIAWYDPRNAGPGASFLVLIDKVLGRDALWKIAVDQEPVFYGSFNDIAQAMVRGRAMIGLGANPKLVFKEYYAAGLPLDIRPLGNTPETAWRGTDGCTLAVMNGRPHPNAARLFVNWIMTKRVSELMAKAQHYDSRRTDIPPLDPTYAAIRGAHYVDAQSEDNDALHAMLRDEMKKRRPQ